MSSSSRVLSRAAALCAAIVIGLLCLLQAPDVRAASPVPARIEVLNEDGAKLTGLISVQRAGFRKLKARALAADGTPIDVPIAWFVDTPGVITIKTEDAGRKATITGLKDLFDDPNGYEPWTNIRACVGDVCQWELVSGIVNLSGKWSVDIEVTNSWFGDDTVTLSFSQKGRFLTCIGGVVGKKPMIGKIDGRVITFTDPNGKLTKFTGLIKGRRQARGTWRDHRGYEGNWTAR